MKEITRNQNKTELKKLQVIEYLLNIDKQDQITIFKLLANDLELTNLQEAKKLLECSYNGVEWRAETVTISNKKFAILKK